MSTDPRFAEPTPFARLVYAHAVERRAATPASPCRWRARSSSRARPARRGARCCCTCCSRWRRSRSSPRCSGPALDRTKGGRRLLRGRRRRRAGPLLCVVMAHVHQQARARGPARVPAGVRRARARRRATRSPRARSCPPLVTDDAELVNANSRLALISVIGASVGGAARVRGVQQLFGADWSLRFARGRVRRRGDPRVPDPEDATRASPTTSSSSSSNGRSCTSRASCSRASAMAVLRAQRRVPGVLRRVLAQGRPRSRSGSAGVGGVHRRLRRRARRARAAPLGAGGGDPRVVARAPRGVHAARRAGRRRRSASCSPRSRSAIGAAAGRLGFDSLLQRDGPDAVRGRAFAKFETRFQLVWVVGGMIGDHPVRQADGAVPPRDRARLRGGVVRRRAARRARRGDAHEAAARKRSTAPSRPIARSGRRPRAKRRFRKPARARHPTRRPPNRLSGY